MQEYFKQFSKYMLCSLVSPVLTVFQTNSLSQCLLQCSVTWGPDGYTCSCFGLITTMHILTRKHAYPINTVHCECSDTGHSIMYIPLLDILSFLIDNIEIKRTDNTPIASDFFSERKSCIFYVGLKNEQLLSGRMTC